MIRLMDLEFMFIKMVQNMRVNGKMIYNMDLARKYGLMDQNMKEIIMKEKNTEEDYIYGKMAQCIMVIGLIIELKDMVNINGKTEENLMENG
jgi:hypothetical protein